MEKWYKYLYYTENVAVNIERVDVVEAITGRETLDYVLRTLKLLDEIRGDYNLTDREYEIIRTVLQWSEVAKGGTVEDRANWLKKGYPLNIHNIASAEIYREETGDSDELTYILIKTHGMIGQCLRGEVPVAGNAELAGMTDPDGRMLQALNECIIRGVSDSLWERVYDRAVELIKRVIKGDLYEFDSITRIHGLLPGIGDVPEKLISLFETEFFPKYELWYFEAALSDFSAEQITEILKELSEKIPSRNNIKYISFKPLADSLYYDYENKKHINVYKKRIIEKYLRDNSTENVELSVEMSGGAALVDFKFTKVCEKLIEFCVEAERSGLLTFEKSITVLYDMFGFRRDEFDRLNNEDKYLDTMNASENSTKNSIIDYVVGNTVVDVGSGGGVLLDLLEDKYPDKNIIGTDISENVIDVLNKKKKSEGHKWNVKRHNFVDGPFLVEGRTGKINSIIFSSIIHEIFSYTETAEGRFNIDTVKTALKNAYESLRPGGRIIIRDGVKTPVPIKENGEIDTPADTLAVTFLEKSGMDFFKNYMKDFEGLPDIQDRRILIDEEECRVEGCTNFIREFLYTYTWGQESYSHEVQEQFGYFTIEEYEEFFKSLGARVIRADAFLEPGYPEHLKSKIVLEPDKYPDSNCIVVVEKPYLVA